MKLADNEFGKAFWNVFIPAIGSSFRRRLEELKLFQELWESSFIREMDEFVALFQRSEE